MELLQSAPAKVDAGTDITLKVKASCPSACDLRGSMVRVLAQDGSVLHEAALAGCEEGSSETDAFTVKAPVELGEFTWSVVFPAQEMAGVLHEECAAPLTFTVKPHATSLAVWDIPSPIPFSSMFTIKVGVKCSAACSLVGQKIDIYDEQREKVATAALGSTPWPGTSALYWAEVELDAPDTEGYYKWEVRFPQPDIDLPHDEASYTFAFTTARPPEHVVRVEVITHDKKTPVKNAQVLMRPQRGYPYRGYTDEDGVARLAVPKAEYELYVSKTSYEVFRTTIEVTDDVSVQAEIIASPSVLF